jgi:uncharacterized protein (DUF58 family)
MMMTSGRFLTAFTVALAVVTVGLLSRRGEIVALSLPLFFYCASLLASRAVIPEAHLDASRAFDANRVNENEAVEVTLTLVNRGPALAVVAVRDEIPPGAVLVDGEARFLGGLRPDETRTLSYSIRAERGQHHQRSVHVTSWSRAGLASREWTIDVATTLSSLPRAHNLDFITIRPRRTHSFAGPVRANLGGAGIELFGCRAYAPGDDIRRINWRASARHDGLIINEYEQERMTDVDLILDARASVHLQTESLNTFDRAVGAAASLATHFIRSGNRVGLLTYGDYLDWIFPAAGRVQLERITTALARARLASRVVFEELRRIPARLFAAGSQLVVVSPLSNDEDFEVLSMLVARGYSVLLVYLNTLSVERSALPDSRATQLASRLAQLRLNLALRALRTADVLVADWNVDEPLNVALHSAQLHPGRGRSRR